MMPRWGELPMDPETESGIAAMEREQITKPRPMELDGPPLHLPVKIEQPCSYDVPIECTFGDALVSHNIALIQHAKKLRTMMANLQQHIDNPQKFSEIEDPMPLFPTLQTVDTTEKKFLSDSKMDECFFSNFRQGKGEISPEINEQLAKKILRKALAVMCAHSGFETTSESVLDTLLDVLSEYYLKITHLLRAAVDREVLARGTTFPDVLEQVFYEMGIGSMRNLGVFYQTRIINYHSNLLETCKQLHADYQKLRYPETPKETEDTTLIITEEAIPQIHFPAPEDHDETHPSEATLHLDELQNLQVTFEQESAHDATEEEGSKADQSRTDSILLSLPTSSMPNLNPDEEIVNVIDSPVHTHDNELINAPQLTTILEQHSPFGIGMKVVKTKRKF